MLTLLLALACNDGRDQFEITDPESDTGDTELDDTGDSGTDDTGIDDTGDTQDTGETGDTGTTEGDLDLFNQILDGTLIVSEGMLAIANSGGWPIETESGFIFAHVDSGQSSVALSGDHNSWATDVQMTKAAVWWIEVTIAEPQGSLYKFIEDGSRYVEDPWSRGYRHDDNGTSSIVARAGGHLERWFDIGDSNIAGRTVRVWVPASTLTHSLYTQDGQNLFDPGASYGGWHLEDTLSDNTLVVGIDNSGYDRIDEYTHVQDTIDGSVYGGRGDDYADYVQDTVRPLIEGEYGAAGKSGLLGSSLGGLISLHIAQRHAGDWDFVGSMSGTVGWGSLELTNETIIERYAASGPFGTAVFVDSGGTDPGCYDADGDGINDDASDSDNYCVNRQFADAMSDAGWTWETDLWHWHENGASHNEAAWAARVYRPVQLFEGL